MAFCRQFDLTDLQLVINIGNSGNLTRGAEKSNVSAPPWPPVHASALSRIACAPGSSPERMPASNSPSPATRSFGAPGHNLVLVVPAGLPLGNRTFVEFGETLDYDFIGSTESSAIHSYLVQTAAAIGRMPFRFRVELGNFDVVCRMVQATVGIGVVTRSVALRCRTTMDICVIRLTDNRATRKLHACVRSFDDLPRYTRELVTMFVKEARAMRR